MQTFVNEPDLERLFAGYTEGLKQEYPEAQISQFVICCMDNQRFRVSNVD